MALTHQDVKKIAKLARIRVSDDEVAHFAEELSSLLQWVEQLGEVDTKQVPQLTNVSNMLPYLREDVVTDGGIQEQILANAPDAQYGCFAVPKVIDAE
ncbi:MAG: Asp-tRNA(Asn)/Glu-tRNA(Gln) amidotransferase subunit GatC [Alphaproteobacteria bacterium]|nr:Asp-tRNA(Asn)/Glu-tRNA(Gln) amidotransferase subunit GatC [Alphaproteobacteria bacterium]